MDDIATGFVTNICFLKETKEIIIKYIELEMALQLTPGTPYKIVCHLLVKYDLKS